MPFKIHSDYKPTGDQPKAIQELSDGINNGLLAQTLLGATGTGKTFTVANVIEQVQRPTLILSHNKTLAAQLFSEFKSFFPDNAVEYFVSYYDYYQPEAYLPVSDTYIEKDLSINDEIEKLRLRATSALLSGRRDVLVVASVSCIYGIGNPEEFNKGIINIKVGDEIGRNKFLRRLVENLYARNDYDFERGNFRVKGDTVDIYLAYADFALRVFFWGDEIEAIETFDPSPNGKKLEEHDHYNIFPANIFVTSQNTINNAIGKIEVDLGNRITQFEEEKKLIEAQRIRERVNMDLEMIRELGYCSGIENYSRYFDQRNPGSRPFCLLDYFPDDFLLVVDESHVTMPQIKAMYGGDRARKVNLVDYGFRLPAAMDNRPLKFEEFLNVVGQRVYVSATPADFELQESEGIIVEQIIRPTGLLDPVIEVRPSLNQIDDLMEEILQRVEKEERALVTTLTKRMAEELSKYLIKMGIKTRYIHSEVDTLERVEILQELRHGRFDVLVGVNLLREGLDLPEVSLVAILDADKEGFLRSTRSLVQTVGRAARNVNGRVLMYADKITDSMQQTIDETNRRRALQIEYNEDHNQTPTQIVKKKENPLMHITGQEKAYKQEESVADIAADPVMQYMTIPQLEKAIQHSQKQMQKAAKDLDFIEAARLRDEMFTYQELLKQKKSNK